jgi:hypothetical protein
LDQVRSLPDEGYYGGSLVRLGEPAYVSGTGILMSRDLVELAAGDDSWDYDVIDDVALGRVMRRAGVEPRELPRLDMESVDQPVDPATLRSCFLVRCKSPVDRKLDVPIMHRVHDLYLRSGRAPDSRAAPS